jgi:hypothetical protein
MITAQNDVEYYRRREAQCNQLAEKARDPGIKKMHRKMAATYAVKTAELEQKELLRA